MADLLVLSNIYQKKLRLVIDRQEDVKIRLAAIGNCRKHTD
jgi:hypothetical protein